MADPHGEDQDAVGDQDEDDLDGSHRPGARQRDAARPRRSGAAASAGCCVRREGAWAGRACRSLASAPETILRTGDRALSVTSDEPRRLTHEIDASIVARRSAMFPRRGAIALVTTAIALVLLFNFKTPDQLPASNGIASTGGSVSTTPAPTTGSTAGNGSSSGTRRPARARRRLDGDAVSGGGTTGSRDPDRDHRLVALRQHPGPGHDHERPDHLGHRASSCRPAADPARSRSTSSRSCRARR